MMWFIASLFAISSVGWTLLNQSAESLCPLSEMSHQLVFSEDFDDSNALSHFKQSQPDLGFKAGSTQKSAWRIEKGVLIGEDAHNATLWLQKMMPSGDLRVTFTARALSKDGDVKCEFAGDGTLHQSGYILINGGWKNSLRVIARQDEHGEDRRQDHRCHSQLKCAPHNQEMHWTIERRGQVISWYLDHKLTLRYVDKNSLQGRFFGFGNWSAPVAFDQLKIYQISNK